ncbi:MAG: hypothetical protein OEW42_16820 [Acidimicrobiia bacterium]|nr:hypothetical protein [Acidimicrobiia bacterium]
MTLGRSQWTALVLLAIGIVHAGVMLSVDRSTGYLIGWPLLIGVAFFAGLLSPRHWAVWGVVALAPLAVFTVFGDIVVSSDDRGTGSVTVFVVIVQALVATGASLMGAQLAQLAATRGVRSDKGRGVATTLALLAVGAMAAIALQATTDSPDNDPLESGLFWYLWIAFPVVAFVAGMVFPKLSAWWGFALTLPAMGLVFLGGSVFYDSDAGASFWVMGEVVLLVLAAWSTLFAVMGAATARRLGRETISAGAHG